MPKAAPGSEVLDLKEFTEAAGGLREGASLVEFIKDGTKLRRLFEAAENLTESIEKVLEGLEAYKKAREEATRNGIILKPDSANCGKCGNHEDSAHIDKNYGPGQMDVLRGLKQTDQTRDTTNNH